MTEKPEKEQPRLTEKAKSESDNRKEREAEALRANLRKRKAASSNPETKE